MKIKRLLLLGAIATLTPALAVVTSSCVNNTDKVEADMGSFDVIHSNELVKNAAQLHFVGNDEEFKFDKENTTAILHVGKENYDLNVKVSKILTDENNKSDFRYAVSFETPDIKIINEGTTGSLEINFAYTLHNNEKTLNIHKENIKIEENKTGISNFKVINTSFYANEENFRNAFEFDYVSIPESNLGIKFIKTDTTASEGTEIQIENEYVNQDDGSQKVSVNLRLVDEVKAKDEVIGGHLKIFNANTGDIYYESEEISLNKFIKVTPSFEQKISSVDFNTAKIDAVATISFNTLLDADATINLKNQDGWTAEAKIVDNLMTISATPKWNAESRTEKFLGVIELSINGQLTEKYTLNLDVKNGEIKSSFEPADKTFNSTQTELNLGKITLENTFKSDEVKISLDDESVWTLKTTIADNKDSADLKLVREVPTQKPVDFNGNLSIEVNGKKIGDAIKFAIKYEAEEMKADFTITAKEFKVGQKIDNAGTVKLENVQKWDLSSVNYSLTSESTDWKLDVKNDTISLEPGKDEKNFKGTITCKVGEVKIGECDVNLNVIKATTYTYTQTSDITFDSKTTTLNLGQIKLDNLRSENVVVELAQNDKWTLKFTFNKENQTVDLTLDKIEAAELTADFAGKLTVKVDGSQIGVVTDFTVKFKA